MRLFLLFMACGTNSGAPAVNDMAMSVLPDLAVSLDFTVPSMCAATDPMSDGQACGNACPAGTIAVGSAADCKCWQVCDPETPVQCPCDRRCAPLTRGDMGVVGGACIVANGPGERCGESGGTGLNAEGCAQSMLCVNADDAGMFRYCNLDCTNGEACPAQTTCTQLTGVPAKACIYDTAPNGVAAGGACGAGMPCAENLLCESGTCKPQCDRAGATCAAGTCTALTGGAQTVGYVCK
jgi:hypothetical protein